jgi:hypothetical protein
MKTMAALLTLAACAWLATTPAHAQNMQSFVSGVGLDSNPCTRGSPCQTFAAAISQTNIAGVITCLDAANYGDVVLAKSVTIDCTDAPGSVVNGAVTIGSALPANSTIVLRGLHFFGANFSTVSPIFSNVHLTLIVEDCTANGYKFLSGSNGNGLYFAPVGAGTSKVTLNRVRFVNMGNNGIYVDSTASSSSIQVSVRDSLLSSNAGSGILTNASPATEIRLMIINTEISKNGIGVNSNGGQSHVIIGRSTVTENQVGLATAGGGAIYSYGTNEINGNNNDNVNASTLISQN